jgi:hypothetical protein
MELVRERHLHHKLMAMGLVAEVAAGIPHPFRDEDFGVAVAKLNSLMIEILALVMEGEGTVEGGKPI